MLQTQSYSGIQGIQYIVAEMSTPLSVEAFVLMYTNTFSLMIELTEIIPFPV